MGFFKEDVFDKHPICEPCLDAAEDDSTDSAPRGRGAKQLEGEAAHNLGKQNGNGERRRGKERLAIDGW